MRHLILGDIHGHDRWKKHIELQNPNKIVFIGDYFDHPEITALDQLNNFQEIIELKKSRPDVTLLIGNHDTHYLGIGEQYSGYQFGARPNIEQILKENREHLQWCHSIQDYLFTHAGVTKTWCENHEVDLDNVVDSINGLDVRRFAFAGWDRYGDSVVSGPTWVRPASLRKDKIDGWKQVVGHTRQPFLNIEDPDILLIDTLAQSQALVLEETDNGIKLDISKI